MKSSIQILKELKSQDYQHYLILLVTPRKYRRAFTSLYCFNSELDKIRYITTEQSTAYIRLQWWREAIYEIYNNKITHRQNHPITNELALTIKEYSLEHKIFEKIIDSYEKMLEPHNTQSLKELEELYAESFGGILELCNIVGKSKESPKNIAVAYCLVNSIVRIRKTSLNNQNLVPQELIEKHNINRTKFLENIDKNKNSLIVKELCDRAKVLSQGCHKSLHKVMVERLVSNAEQAQYKAFEVDLSIYSKDIVAFIMKAVFSRIIRPRP